MEYYLSTHHWIDAHTIPPDKYLKFLSKTLKCVLAEHCIPRDISLPTAGSKQSFQTDNSTTDRGATIFELSDDLTASGLIKVIGVGHGGGKIVEHMTHILSDIEFICLNTDQPALSDLHVSKKILIGKNTLRGLGSGGNPELSREAAQEDRKIIEKQLVGADLVFIISMLGGGSTGAIPVIAQITKELGILTIVVAGTPFPFERRKRSCIADASINSICKYADSTILIKGSTLYSCAHENVNLADLFKASREFIVQSVECFVDIINKPGLINVDFADIRSLMSESGIAWIGIGTASGKGRAGKATSVAINGAMLKEVQLEKATGVLVNITCDSSLTLSEYNEVANIITNKFSVTPYQRIEMATVHNTEMKNTLQVSIIATGYNAPSSDHLKH